MTDGAALFTIGHSNHSLADFLSLLERHGITAVADVRSHPVSRRNPHFNREELEPALRQLGIVYVFLGAELGGRPGQPSLYDADGRLNYERMRTTDLAQRGLERLDAARQKFTVALMCSEEDPLDCHRGLMIAPALIERGVMLAHIRGDGTLEPMSVMEERLVAETGIASGLLDGLFASTFGETERRELVAEAYRKMAQKKAFRLKPGERVPSAIEADQDW
jgi:uncharacterized protein (DUF488 family)